MLTRLERFSHLFIGMLVICMMASMFVGCGDGSDGADGADGTNGTDGAPGPAGLTPEQIAAGTAIEFDATASGVSVDENGLVSIQFSASDARNGAPLLDLTSSDFFAGAVLAWPVPDYTNDVSVWFSSDNLVPNSPADGTYTFTFPDPVDVSSTDTFAIGFQGRSSDSESGASRGMVQIAPIYFRVDGGSPIATPFLAVDEASCTTCHSEVRMHGELRAGVALCAMCHNVNQDSDPEGIGLPTVSVNLREMIHKIHSGSNLENPYITGGHGGDADFSGVVFPQPIQNCSACHDGNSVEIADIADTTPPLNVDGVETTPVKATCTSCHDSSEVATHVGSFADTACVGCHAEGGFVGSVEEVHELPQPFLSLEMNVSDITVDEAGLISFTFAAYNTVADTLIMDVDDTDKYRVGYMVGWLAAEYEVEPVGNSNMGGDLVNNGDGTYTYTETDPDNALTGAADESYGFQFRGRAHLDLNGSGDGTDEDGYETRVAKVAQDTLTFRLDGGVAETRRVLVQDSACAACHGGPFEGHGSDRVGVQNCVFCHNTNLNSTPDDATYPTVSVNFKDMIHKIHSGEELANGYVTAGHSGDVDFGEVVFPNNLADCSVCHGDNDISLPLSDDAIATWVDANGDGIVDMNELTPPTAAACLSCHDDDLAAQHAALNNSDTGLETCALCHGPGKDVDVADVHE